MVTPVTWQDVGKAMTECFLNARPGSEHCFHSDILSRSDVHLTDWQIRLAEKGTIWFDSGDYLVISGLRLPLTTEMVPCDTHRALAAPLLEEGD